MRELHLAQGEQRWLPQVVFNRRRWASFFAYAYRGMCDTPLTAHACLSHDHLLTHPRTVQELGQ